MSPPTRSGRRVPWETTVLGWLAYPANLALAGVAAFVLALPLVTALSAATAAGVALEQWRKDDEDGVFLGTFRAWRRTWRRTLPTGAVAALVGAVLVVNWLFLLSRDSPLAIVMMGALVPVSLVALLLAVHFPAAVAAQPDGDRAAWLRASFAASVASPLRALVVCVVVVTWVALCLLLPTVVPFFGLSLPVFVGLVSADGERRHDRR